MEPATVPGLTSALRARGYRVRGPVGLGSGGPAWAVDAPDGQRGVVTVLDLARQTLAARRAALERVEALRTVRHAHVVELLDVVAVDAHRTALVTTEVEGPTVGAVLAARPAWAAGEIVTLVAPLADAIHALRAAGLRHGDVAPENVVLAPGGRPVLVDLASVALPPAGTPGFAAPAGPDDVFSLARLGLAALGPVRAGEVGADRLRAALEAACAPDASRPAPLDLARACFDAADPLPIELPDAAVLTRAALTRLSEHRPPDRTVQDPRVARRRRVMAGVGAVAAAASLAVTLAVVGAPAPDDVRVARPAGQPAGAGGGVDREHGEGGPDGADVVGAAVELTHRRAELLSERSVEGLTDVTVRGSAAFEADRALLATLAEREDALVVRVEDVEATWLGSRDGRELVLVTSTLRVAGEAEGEPGRSVVLALTETAAGWRVAEVLAPDVAGFSAPVGPLAG